MERFGWLPPAVEVARMDARHELAKLRAAAGSEWDKRAVDARVRAASARDAAVTASHSPAATPDRVPPGEGEPGAAEAKSERIELTVLEAIAVAHHQGAA